MNRPDNLRLICSACEAPAVEVSGVVQECACGCRKFTAAITGHTARAMLLVATFTKALCEIDLDAAIADLRANPPSAGRGIKMQERLLVLMEMLRPVREQSRKSVAETQAESSPERN